MIQAKTPIVNNQQVSNNDAEFFTAENKIVPIRRITHESITQIEDFREEQIIPEQKVQAIIREKKTSNPFAKFFKNVLKYVDKLEDFIDVVQKLQLKSVVQKKILLQSEKTDQTLRTYQSKRIVKDVKESEEDQEKESVNLKDNPQLGSMLAAALGLGAAAALIPPGGDSEIHEDVVSEGEFAVQRGQNVSRPPAWIPFPKGTSGLIYNSGYGMRLNPVTGRYRQHAGIDVAGPTGAPIITPISGVVSFAGDEGDGYGYKVVITSGQLKMLFGHMYQPPPVRGGQQVQAGTVIGGIGRTGQSTGPHLHWNVYVNGSTVNPVDWTYNNPPSTATAGARSVDGPPLDNESEGGINQSRRIMVGEAGREFVVPMSQMPLFIQGMVEEKIKCLNPTYEVSEGFDDTLKTLNGSAKTAFASGGITGGSPEFWQMVAISAREDMRNPQGQADVAQSIYNRAALGSYPGGKSVKGIITAEGQYQPTFTNPGAWSSITNKKTAVEAAGKGPSLIDMAARSITNPVLQSEAAKFVGGRTDFMGESQKPYMKSGDITRGKEHNFFGWFYDARLPKAAPVRPSVKSMTKATNTPPKPKAKAKDKNIFEKIMEIIMPPSKKTASLDDVENQMEISKDYQNQFSFENSTNEIIALYKPTVYYSEVS